MTLHGGALSAPAPPESFRHEGLAYAGPTAFVGIAAGLLSDGLRAGEACMFLAAPDKVDAVRDVLGDAGHSASYFDMSVQGRNPGRVLPALHAFVESHRGRRARVVGEPVVTGLREAVLAEAELGDLMLGLPMQRSWLCTLTCLYDRTSLPAEISDLLETSHSPDVGAGDVEASVTARFIAPLPSPPDGATRIVAEVGSLADVRRSLAAFAQGNGLTSERTDDLVYAVNEAVTNSLCHGEGRARVHFWLEDGSPSGAVVCEVDDRGCITDPLVGRRTPTVGQTSGRGLWLVHQLCDLVQVRSSAERGTQVRMSVDL